MSLQVLNLEILYNLNQKPKVKSKLSVGVNGKSQQQLFVFLKSSSYIIHRLI